MMIVADENIARSIVDALREAGHDVLSISETRFGMDDSSVLFLAVQEGRVLVTFDLDFADTATYPPESHRGIVLLRYRNQLPEHLSAHVVGLFDGKTQEYFDKRLVVLAEGRVRSYKDIRG